MTLLEVRERVGTFECFSHYLLFPLKCSLDDSSENMVDVNTKEHRRVNFASLFAELSVLLSV